MKCCILQCGARKNKLHPKLTLHRFPSNKSLRNKWLEIIGPENINPGLQNLFVCSLHFVEASFNRTLNVVRLHDGAVPSILIPAKTNISNLPMPQSTRFVEVELLHDSQNQDAQIVDVVIEKYTDNVRFCIICNYLGKIIPALQSRCTRFRFAPLHHDQIVPRLQHVVEQENVKISEDGMKALLTLSGGDMRKVLNTLQSTWLAYRDVTENNVYTCVGHPLRADINNIVNWLLNENDFAACFQHIQDLKIAKGLALGDILTEVHTVIQRLRLPAGVLVSLLIAMSESEARLAGGAAERVELAALVAAFQRARDDLPLPTDADTAADSTDTQNV